jgi:hypothetical protein
MQKSLKPLVALLKLWRDSNEIFGRPKGDSTYVVCWCSPVSFPCLKRPFIVHSVLLFFAEVRRRCCTSKRCTAVCSVFGKEQYLCQPIACVIGGPSCQKCPVYGRCEQTVYHSPGEDHYLEFKLRCKFKREACASRKL